MFLMSGDSETIEDSTERRFLLQQGEEIFTLLFRVVIS